MFSGGLDSRLAVKIMQEQGFEVLSLFFKLPFSKDVEKDAGEFLKKNKVKFKIFDVAKEKLLKEYLKVLKKGEHGRGAGFNPCKDCKIWMFKKAKKYAKEKGVKVIATGEVLGQRPMSQTKKAMRIIDKEIGFELTRPLIELGFSGRRRDKQMSLAKKFKISYPSPAGGCLLCEKELKKRFEILIGNNLINERTLPLVNVGRHFFVKRCWFVVGRDARESKVIDKFKSSVKSKKGKPAVYFSKKSGKKFAEELQEDYKTKGVKKYSGERL